MYLFLFSFIQTHTHTHTPRSLCSYLLPVHAWENLHTKWSILSTASLRAHLKILLHSGQNRHYVVKHHCDQAGLWKCKKKKKKKAAEHSQKKMEALWHLLRINSYLQNAVHSASGANVCRGCCTGIQLYIILHSYLMELQLQLSTLPIAENLNCRWWISGNS